MIKYGELLRTCRKAAGLTQAELAKRAYTTQAVVSAYETGKSSPDINTYSDLIEVCGYEIGIREKRDAITIEEMVKYMEEPKWR